MAILTGERIEMLHHVMVEATNEAAIILKPEGEIVSCNSRFSQMVQMPAEQVVKTSWQVFFAAEQHRALEIFLERARRTGSRNEFTLLAADGSKLAVELSIRMFNCEEEEGFFVEIADISALKRQEEEHNQLVNLHKGRNRLLEMIADRAPLGSILENLTLLIEKQCKGMICSVLLLDKDGLHLRHGAAPSLPSDYIRAVDGEGVGPQAGSCGTAVYRGETVVVSDIETDPLWAKYRDFTLPHGLRACWSAPILGHDNRVLGTFAMYYREPRSPTQAELNFGRIGIDVARIAIEHQRAEEALRESEERYRMLHRDNPTMIFTADAQGKVLSVNPFATFWLGYSAEELEGAPIMKIVFEEDRAFVKEQIDSCLSNPNQVYHWQFRKVRKDGGLLWVEELAQSIIGVDGNPTILIVCQNITERKRAEEELQKAMERLNMAQEAGHVCVWDWDMVSGKRFWTKEFARICGLDPGNCVDMYEAWQKIVHPEDLPNLLKYIEKSLREHRKDVHGDYRIIRPDGRERWLTYRGVCHYDAKGNPTRMIGTLADITERKRSEEQLRYSEGFLNSIIEQSPMSMWISGAKGTFLRGNQALRNNIEVTDEEMVGRYNLFEDEVLEEHGLMPLVREVFEIGKTVNFNLEYDSSRLRHLKLAKTKCLWLDITIAPVFGANGKVTNAIIEHFDITEKRKAEEALRRSEERFRTMADSVPEIIFTCDSNGVNDYKNMRFYEYTGVPPGTVGQETWLNSMHPEERDRVESNWKEAVKKGEPLEMQFRLRAANGEYRWFLTRALPIRDCKGKVVQWLGTCTDIETQKRAEEYLEREVARRTAKLQETVGELEQYSYSITHDLRAPLRAIQGYAQILKEDSADQLPAACEEPLRRIMSATQRMENLIRDSLNYGKLLQTEIKAEPVNVDTLIREIIQSYPELQPPKAEVKVEGEFPLVMGNDGGLAQCVSNLLRNAVKFVAPGTKPRVRVLPEERGEWVRIWFEDNGIGIAKELQEVIFGMFQQLDKRYEGSGIGLSIVRKAMERMGGKAGVESELGQGSRFWLELKRA